MTTAPPTAGAGTRPPLYRVNLDYEYELFGPPLGPSLRTRLAVEFEHVFFYAHKGSGALASELAYGNDFLDHVEGLGLERRQVLAPSVDARPWWGALKDPATERTLNSKLTAARIGQRLGACPAEVLVVSSAQELLEQVGTLNTHVNWVLKAEGRMGGQGHLIFTRDEALEGVPRLGLHSAMAQGPRALSPYYPRLADIGTTVDLDSGTCRHNRSFINRQGNFKGGYLLDPEAGPGPRRLAEKARELVPRLSQAYKDLGAKGGLQFDSFEYAGGDYLFLEANYRRTMASMLQGLPSTGVWLILESAPWKDVPHLGALMRLLGKQAYRQGVGILPTSPLGVGSQGRERRPESIGLYFAHPDWSGVAGLLERFANLLPRGGANALLLESVAREITASN